MPVARKPTAIAAGVFTAGAFAAVLLMFRIPSPQARVSGSGQQEADVTSERMDRLAVACEEYNRIAGNWPISAALAASAVRLEDTNVIFDGWGRAIQLGRSGDTAWLISYGADGLPGGLGTNADIVEYLRAKPK